MRKFIFILFLVIFLSGCLQRHVLKDMTVPEGDEDQQGLPVNETPETTGSSEQGVLEESTEGANKKEEFEGGEEETTYYIQPIFFSPGKVSSRKYIEDRIEILEKILNDERYQLSSEQREFYTVMLNEYLNGSRDETRDEPHDGSVFTGVQGEAAMDEKREGIEVLMDHVKEFYRYHTGRALNIKPVIAVIGEEAMMYYWHPVIHSFDNIDHNALGNTIGEELERRNIISRDKKFKNVIQVLLVEGAGGWAGAGGCCGHGDLLVGELVTSCLSYPDEPARNSEGREKWANHIYYSGEICTYNQAIGTLIHELGHTFGLPHPESCSNYAETLVMMNHWNVDIRELGFMKNPENVDMDYVGILKDSSKCNDPRHHDYAYQFEEGYPLDCMPGSGYHSELELLLDNPQFNQ